jgi:glycolate oxidase iron-sulfur subunit
MRANAIEGLDPCVHCGFCLQSCPTYRVSDDEAESPRGRIVLMQALASRRLPPTDRTLIAHLDQCLGCRACEPACPSGVEYGPAIEETRRILEDHRPVPLVVRLIHGVIEEALLRRPIFGAARMMRPAARWFSGSSRVGTALGMLAATEPWRPNGREPGTDRDRSAAEQRASVSDRGVVTLFRGCVMDDLFSHVHDASVRVLEANSYRIVEVADQGCCGALHAHAGQHDAAVDLARRNVAAFSGLSSDIPIAVNAAGCGAILKEYGRLLQGTPEETEAHAHAARVIDVTELLAAAGPRQGASLHLRVAYDPPCHLVHAQRITDPPEAVLAAVPGHQRVHHDDAALCCGSAGSYTFAQPEVSDRVLALKVAALCAANPDVVVTGNPGCIMQIGAGLRATGLDVPVVHPVEFLDWSYERAGYYAR